MNRIAIKGRKPSNLGSMSQSHIPTFNM